MNNKLIEKVIQTNLGTCPQLVYKNPVLDRKVAGALAKSFVKIISLTKTNSAAVQNNLRTTILENIRRMCIVHPENHIPVDENLSEALCEIYLKQSQQLTSGNCLNKELDTLLMKRFKAANVDSLYETSLNPEIVQALLNLNNSGVYLDFLAKDILHWNVNKGKFSTITKDLWSNNDADESINSMYDNLAIKMKPEIEQIILNVCHNILTHQNYNENEISDPTVTQLIERCSISPICFQICTRALNFILIMTNFDSRLQMFIPEFVSKIKAQCPKVTFSILYPVHMNHIVVMLDFNTKVLPEPLRVHYVAPTLKYMRELRERSEHDFIMLLSHFPQWFDIYFNGDVDR